MISVYNCYIVSRNDTNLLARAFKRALMFNPLNA